MKQKVMVPSYFEEFTCIAGKCEETCCAGWYIAIDEAAYKKYKKVKDPGMKKRLEKEVVERKGSVSKACVAKIKLKNNRCAFLAKDNLCDLYKQLGESYLSETCRVYPRNINQVGEKQELSLALSCPEAARRILLSKDKMTFKEEEDRWHLPVVGGHVTIEAGRWRHFEDAFIVIRQQLIDLLQDNTRGFMERWGRLAAYFEQLDRYKKNQDIKGLTTFLTQKEVNVKAKAMLSDTESMKGLFQALVAMRSQKKWPSTRYEDCYEKMVRGLSETSAPLIWSAQRYEQGAELFEKEVLKKWDFVLENYFTQYIYERLVPLDQASPLESLKEMTLYRQLLKLHITGILMDKGKIEAEELVTLIQSFTRVFDHNAQCREQLKKMILQSKA